MNILKLTGAALCAAMLAAPAFAQSDISKPECIAPANPGGGFDLTCRVAQTGLESHITSPVQVTFMPGGIGAVAFNQFNTNRTDDASAIVAFSTGSLLNLILGKYGDYSEKDVRWLATAGADFGAVVVRADSPYQSLKDVMDALSSNPGGVGVGAGGKPMDMRYVAFDGGGDAIAALLGGSIEVYTGDVGEMVPHLESGDMRILATLSPERLDAPFDQFPTAKEEGYDVEWTIMRGFYMGKNVSDADYQKWVDAFDAAYASEEFAKVQAEKGLLPLNMSGDELTASIEKTLGELRVIAKEAGLIQYPDHVDCGPPRHGATPSVLRHLTPDKE
jgi:putative tricarboxylic transport membrane protein